MQRRKGAVGEREIAGVLSDVFGRPIKRLLGQARDSGHDITLPPFAIEVKRRARIHGIYDWIAQAQSGTPVLMMRADGKEWLVTMKLADWCKLAREEIADDSRVPAVD
jgi:Holliday junction resolvase